MFQEVWLGNEELVDMYEKRLGDAGYISFKLARANNRGDGIINFLFFQVVTNCIDRTFIFIFFNVLIAAPICFFQFLV